MKTLHTTAKPLAVMEEVTLTADSPAAAEDDDDRSSFGLDNNLFTHVIMDNLGVDEDSANNILALSGLILSPFSFLWYCKAIL